MNFFDQFPEFIEADSRKGRGFSTVTAESISKRHEAALPDWLVYNSSVLDLGSCFGSTGHWVLSKGAKSYTGVEVQPAMVETSKQLLSNYWSTNKFSIVEQDIKTFLDGEIQKGNKYDVISMFGVIYAFVNTFEILEKVSMICNHAIVIDSLYPYYFIGPDSTVIELQAKQHINSPESNTTFYGIGARPTPAALRFIMKIYGFEDKEDLIYPTRLTDESIHDSFNHLIEKNSRRVYPSPARFLIRFFQNKNITLKEVSQNVANNNTNTKGEMALAPKVKELSSWAFDKSVAQRFQTEAQTHIPDYDRVINLCISVAEEVYGSKKDISIIDVGSALGHTIDVFSSAGYTNLKGVESSSSMIELSKHKEKIVLSDTFVHGNYDLVLANWTLHFIQNRKDYLNDIFNSLNHEGTLILSDKMDFTPEMENLYHTWKRSQGVSQEVIDKKKAAITGVLVTKSLGWYLTVLEDIGFSNIQIINNKFMFTTIYARKF